jgi:hypothetical protein
LNEIKTLCFTRKLNNLKEKTKFLEDEIIPQFSAKLKVANIKTETKKSINDFAKSIGLDIETLNYILKSNGDIPYSKYRNIIDTISKHSDNNYFFVSYFLLQYKLIIMIFI